MILCEKCSENTPRLVYSTDGDCKIHGKIIFNVFEQKIKRQCFKCAKEQGICQVCGCDLKTEE